MAAGPGRHVRCVSPGPTAPRVGRGELVCKTGPWYLPRIFLILSDFVVHMSLSRFLSGMMRLSHHNTVTGGTTHGRCTVHRAAVPSDGVLGFHERDA